MALIIVEEVSLSAAQITGTVQLEGLKTDWLFFIEARIEHGGDLALLIKDTGVAKKINRSAAQITGTVQIKNLETKELSLERAQIIGAVHIESLEGSRLSLVDACIEWAGGVALLIKHTKLPEGVNLNAPQITGAVQVESLEANELSLREARIEHAGDVALLIKEGKVWGWGRVANRREAGEVAMNEVQIIGGVQIESLEAGRLSLKGACIEHEGNMALLIKKGKIRNEIAMDEAQITGALQVESLGAWELSLKGACIERAGEVALLVQDAGIHLSGAQIRGAVGGDRG